MELTCGIVGLPNAGKSTFFNALIQSSVASVANFPFCTIEPNHGIACVPDERLKKLAHINQSEKIIPANLTFTDIAGIVEGASQGQGLGNKFLGHIREVDIIACLLRCFENDDIIHVKNKVDPVEDLKTIETELMLADLESCQRRLEKKIKKDDKEGLRAQEMIELAYQALKEGKPARDALNSKPFSPEDLKVWNTLGLLTQKKVVYVLNVDASSVEKGNALSEACEEYIKSNHSTPAIIRACASFEAELIDFSDSEKEEYLHSFDIQKSVLDNFVETVFKMLNLSTFFTCGPKEARAWTFPKGMLAPSCAGIIHTDFERGFIRAEVISYNDYIRFQGEKGCKENGKMRLEGKEYVMQDGDVVHFRFNV